MISKSQLICILLTSAAIVGGVFTFAWASTPGPVFRGYPDQQDQQLPLMTLDELSKYDGTQGKKSFLAIKNIVFDVSDSDYYRGDGAYSQFAGKDCSIMIALWKTDTRYANLYNTIFYDKLTEQQKQSLDDMYSGTYSRKYRKVARIWLGSGQADGPIFQDL